MDLVVTQGAQSDQIPFGVVTEQAARLNMMHLEFAHGTTVLAAPPIALQYFFPQFVIRDGIQP
jgi:hypothetical protein